MEQVRLLASEGRYEEALQKHIWIHDHILELDRAYYGVRLSFALGYWVELGTVYPKALEALVAIRDEKTARLLSGNGNRELFHDVVAINVRLDDSSPTVDLFKKLEASQPEFAASVYDLADEALVAAGEYGIARRYLVDPMGRFAKAKRSFEEDMKYARSTENVVVITQSFQQIFTDNVLRIITVLDNTGDSDLAREIQSEALAVLESPAIRDAIKNRDD